MKKKYYIFLCSIYLCIFIFLSGCKYEINKIEPTPAIDSSNVTAETEIITPTITNEPIEANETNQGDTIIQELGIDIDHNGVMDLAQIVDREDGSNYMQVIFNGDNIFHYETVDIRLISVGTFGYLNLDSDDEKEIFITVYPNVNCRPLIDIVTLKQTDSQWHMMDIPLNEDGNNCFPFCITRGKKEFDFIISSEYTNQQIHFDASSFYKDVSESNINSIQAYRNNHFNEGDVVAGISSWGVWEAELGTYDEQNCIIAQEGMEAPYGNGLGRVFIYYVYDENGLIKILNIEYVQ
jgi:hypothetical protein